MRFLKITKLQSQHIYVKTPSIKVYKGQPSEMAHQVNTPANKLEGLSSIPWTHTYIFSIKRNFPQFSNLHVHSQNV